MSMRLFRFGLVFLISFAALSVQQARPNDAALKAGIARMMQDGWNVTPTARAAADAQYAELQGLAPGDSRLLTASALVLLQQRRYDEAGKRFDQLLLQDDDNLLALRARCWLAATFKQYPDAMAFAEKLRAALPAPSTQNEAAESAAREQLAFLGRLCGYLAGPVGADADQAARKQLEKTMLAGLDEERTLIFEQARDGVMQKYLELTDSKIDTEKKNVEDRKLEAEQTLQDVEAARKDIDERVKDIEARGAKLQKELADENAEIQKLDRPLQLDLARLQTRGDLVRRDLAAYQIQIDNLNGQFAREKDPNIRNSIRADINALSFQATRISGELAALNRQAQGVQAQRATLAGRANQAQNNFDGQIDRLNKELVSLGRKEKLADNIEKKAKKPVSGSSAKTSAISGQVTALSTYDKFPLEAARQKLLAELR